MFANHKLQI